MKLFKPSLYPNEQITIEQIKMPVMTSYKLDGIRCIFKNGEMLSRSLKQIPNKQLDENIILDGEIYSEKMTFQQIIHYVMTEDMASAKSIKKNEKIDYPPEDLMFYCFDIVENENFDMSFDERNLLYDKYGLDNQKYIKKVCQKTIYTEEILKNMFDKALKEGYEGLIMKNPYSKYKCGRYTVKSGDGYKMKPYRTFDAQIIGVEQATVVNPEAEKTINELGQSVTSKKLGDRIPIEKAAGFCVMYEGHELKTLLKLNDDQKERVWRNRESLIGRWIEYKGMMIGAKDVPRHSVFLRFRKDKDE